MTYCRQNMVTTRAFLSAVSRTVIAKPSLIFPALSLYSRTRARQSRGVGRFFPSKQYLSFRIYTQYGREDVKPEVLRDDIAAYLAWVKVNK